MKVYCKSCKFNRSAFGIEYETCKPYIIRSGKDDYYSSYHRVNKDNVDIEWMRDLNKNNDCVFYKKKWWRRENHESTRKNKKT